MKTEQMKYSKNTPSNSQREDGLTNEESWLKQQFLGAMRLYNKKPTQEEALLYLETYEGKTPKWVEELPEGKALTKL